MEGKLYKINNIYTLMVNDKMIASNDEDFQIDYEINKLSIKNCESIERGYDIELLSIEYASRFKDDDGTSDVDFMMGFLKALEIFGDKKFSEDDVLNLIKRSRDKKPYNFDGKSTEYKFSEDKLIQSLQQTEWDVEICCYVDNSNGWLDADSFNSPLLTNTGEPKLDADGCLILKRK